MKPGDLIAVREHAPDQTYVNGSGAPHLGIIVSETTDFTRACFGPGNFWVMWEDGTETVPTNFLLSCYEVVQ